MKDPANKYLPSLALSVVSLALSSFGYFELGWPVALLALAAWVVAFLLVDK